MVKLVDIYIMMSIFSAEFEVPNDTPLGIKPVNKLKDFIPEVRTERATISTQGYHLTFQANLASIQRHGLLPNGHHDGIGLSHFHTPILGAILNFADRSENSIAQKSKGKLYFSKNPYQAFYTFQIDSQDRFWRTGGPVILKFTTPETATVEIDQDWKAGGQAFFIKEPIPLENISEILMHNRSKV